MVEKITEHEDNIQRIAKHSNGEAKKLFQLEAIVYDKASELDVFERIYQRIAEVVADRRAVEVVLENNSREIMSSFDLFKFKMDNHEKELKQIVESSRRILDENAEVKDLIRKQSATLTNGIERVHEELLTDQHELRGKLSDLKVLSEGLVGSQGSMKVEIDDLYSQVRTQHDRLGVLERAKIDLELGKCNLSDFQLQKEKVDSSVHDLLEQVAKASDHCQALDQYLDRYQPVRMQSMISETLEACLKDEPRRMHELYHSDKIGLLYRAILEDDGEHRYAITEAIRKLNDKARYIIEEEEKIQKRMAAEEEEAELLEGAAMDSVGNTGTPQSE